MKLEKAIEILQYHSERNADIAGSSWANALKLGIEAMRRVKGLRLYDVGPVQVLLPGETKEVSHGM